ncbi:hypothetical protein Tco_0020435 [Tanacetum coccineum]
MLNKTEDYLLDDLLKFLRIEEEAKTSYKRGKDVSRIYHVQGESSKKRVNRNDSQKAKLRVTKNNFKKFSPSKRTNEVNAVNTEIAKMVAHVHLDDGGYLLA